MCDLCQLYFNKAVKSTVEKVNNPKLVIQKDKKGN